MQGRLSTVEKVRLTIAQKIPYQKHFGSAVIIVETGHSSRDILGCVVLEFSRIPADPFV